MNKNKKENTFEEELAENLEVISNEIKKLQKIGKVLSNSKLNDQTVLWLISRASGVNQHNTKLVIEALQELDDWSRLLLDDEEYFYVGAYYLGDCYREKDWVNEEGELII